MSSAETATSSEVSTSVATRGTGTGSNPGELDSGESDATGDFTSDADSSPPADPRPWCELESGEVLAIASDTPAGVFPVAHAAWGWDICSAAPHIVLAVEPLGTNGDPTPPAVRLGVQLLVDGKGPDLFTGVWPAELQLSTPDRTHDSKLGTIELLEPFAGLDTRDSLETELHVRISADGEGWAFAAEAYAVPRCHEFGNCTCPCG
jgi:hypothetical protein